MRTPRHGALRISMGRYTTAEDVQAFLDAIDSVLNWRIGRYASGLPEGGPD